MGRVPGARSSLRTARPLLLVVEADPERLDRIETELERAFGVDFRVRGELTA
jgi:thioredoxin reductase (NADPH)